MLVAVTVVLAAVLSTAATGLGLSPLVTVPAAVAAALAVTQLLARGMTSPLREMTAAARRMATGDYSRQVTATSRDEVGELARAFNKMASELALVDRQRRELVANVSHELRTPVSALRAVLENLVDGVAQPDPATLKAALAQTERLGDLVSDLLDLSRVDAGITPLSPTRLTVRPFLRAVLEEAALAGHPVRYDLEVDPPDLVVLADRARLHQLLANLLDNAGRHSPPEGRSGCAPTGQVTAWSSRSPTRVPASPRRTGPPSSSGSPPAVPATAAPASGWPSPAGSPSCTAAGSRSRTLRGAA